MFIQDILKFVNLLLQGMMAGAFGNSRILFVVLSLALLLSSCVSHPIVHQTLASMQTKTNPGVRIPLTVRSSSDNQPPSFNTPLRFDPTAVREELQAEVRQDDDDENNTSTESTSTESSDGDAGGTDPQPVEGQAHEHSSTDPSDTTGSTDTTNENGEGTDSDDGENTEGNSEGTTGQVTGTNFNGENSDEGNENNEDTTTGETTEGASDGGEQGETGGEKGTGDESGDGSDSGEANGEMSTTEGDDAQPKTGSTDENTKGAEGLSSETGSSQNTTSDVTSGGATNQTDALLKFKLIQFVESDTTDNAFKDVTVFEDGKLVGPFASSPNTADVGSLSETEAGEMYKDTRYADRIAFKFLYDEESTDYAFEQPTVVTTSTSVISPIMKGYRVDEADSVGFFTIHYHCQQGIGGNAFVGMTMQITKDHKLTVSWSKECGKGRFDKVEFGFMAHDRSVSLFNEDGTYGQLEQKRLEVGPTDTSTDLIMKLVPPAYNLDFKVPIISSDSPDVLVSLRGAITADTLTSEQTTHFSVYYECNAMSKAEIKFSVAIPPWDNVTASWRKDCGGSYSQALLIGTTGAKSFDVMQDGELSPKYNVTESSTLSDVSSSIVQIPGSKKSARFFLTNSDDTADLQIQTISTTMSNPEVMGTFIRTQTLAAVSSIPESGTVLPRQQTKALNLYFMCKKAGKSIVLITLPVLRYKNIEFGFVKECYEPKSYHQSGFLQTAGSILGTVLAILILGGLASFIYIRRRTSEAKYARVATTENGSSSP